MTISDDAKQNAVRQAGVWLSKAGFELDPTPCGPDGWEFKANHPQVCILIHISVGLYPSPAKRLSTEELRAFAERAKSLGLRPYAAILQLNAEGNVVGSMDWQPVPSSPIKPNSPP